MRGAGKARRRRRVVPCKEEQHSQTRAQARKRARSGLTSWVRMNEGTNVSIHASYRRLTSGQLRFLGLCQYPCIVTWENERSTAVSRLKDYTPAYIHIDVKYLPLVYDEDKRRYLFVARPKPRAGYTSPSSPIRVLEPQPLSCVSWLEPPDRDHPHPDRPRVLRKQDKRDRWAAGPLRLVARSPYTGDSQRQGVHRPSVWRQSALAYRPT